MKYEALRNLVKSHPKFEGCVEVSRAPLMHDGFPGTFNLSFTEYDWLREYKRFVDFDHNFNFSTIQSCIRPDDFSLFHTIDSWKYLGVFEIADLTGAINLKEKPDYEKLQTWQISNLITFLNSIGIWSNRIHPSYCAGGTVKELTAGRYNFDFYIPEDKISKNAFLENGVPEKNLIPDKTRDTFLSLHLQRPTPWGYRTEVNTTLSNCNDVELVDIATTEYILWRPVFLGDETSMKNIVGLEENKCGFAISALGLERLCMVINEFPTVRDIDYISPVYDVFNEHIDEYSDEFEVEGLRALHRVYSDINKYGIEPGRHQKAKLKNMFRRSHLDKCSSNALREVLTLHSQTQPWHPELADGIEPTIERIERYKISRHK